MPQADYLRYLTSKLGQYLEINEIELIQLNKITNRYVLDLNLPSIYFVNIIIYYLYYYLIQSNIIKNLTLYQTQNKDELNTIVDLLIDTLNPISKLSLENSQYENLEAIALSYIFVSILIIFYYNPADLSTNSEKNFYIDDWISCMQNRLKNVKIDYFGW